MPSNEDSQRVLFVDDEPGVLKALERELRSEPFLRFYAENARQALEIMEREQVAVIVSDLLMPGCSGLELLDRVRKKYPLTVRIILSSVSDIKQVLEAMRNGCTHRYLTKPWRLREELLPMLHQAMDLHRLLIERDELWKKFVEQNKRLKSMNRELQVYRELENQTRQKQGRHLASFLKKSKAFLTEFAGFEPLTENQALLRKRAAELLELMPRLNVFAALDSHRDEGGSK